MKKMVKQIFILISLIGLLILPYFVFAQNAIINTYEEEVSASMPHETNVKYALAIMDKLIGAGDTSGPYATATKTSMAEIIGKGVSVFLSILGIVFIILVIYGGYTYMNARGEEEKVKKGIATIRMAIIGLILVVGSYAIWWYIYYNFILS